MLRVIARLNMGGPAQHVGLLSGDRFTQRGYDTLLVHGSLAPGEESLASFAEDEGARMVQLPALGAPVNPLRDARASGALARMVRSFRPDIVHTHTAKAGLTGRLAALAGRPRPLIVHTYHGHVLSGYFGRAKTGAYRGLERAAGRVSDALVGVSDATVDELVALGIAPRERFRTIPLGLALERFADLDPVPSPDARSSIGVRPEEVAFVFVGRFVPIKRVDDLLRAFARAREGARAPLRLLLVGDGELRAALEELAAELGVAEAVTFLGYRTDLDRVLAAADAAVLSSANEGTPVSLIEAAAAARPAVATDVGGVADVVTPQTGIVVPPGDYEALARGIEALADDPDQRRRLGAAGRAHALERYSASRLIGDVDALYRDLLSNAGRRG